MHAAPDTALFHRLRAVRPGALIANPVLTELTTEALAAGIDRVLGAGAGPAALGRPFIANPDPVERLRLGAPLNPVRERCFVYVGGTAGYADHPALGRGTAQPSSESIVAWDGPRVA
ncbi:hypothetical protein [Streptomyces antibioticus]|uniref:hypothetical protein n=1 Tax=Streptomyces antibioticus TaxID=1890 RepID=UPI00340F7C77